MSFTTLAQYAADLAAKKCSSVEIVQDCLTKINSANKSLNAFITITEEQALNAAKQADQQRAQGNAGPLSGIPIAHKDIFCTQGVKTTCGSKMLDNFIAPYDAQVVSLCNEAGLINVGKTNMDEFAMGSSNETSFYGPCKNPWNLECVPGGSSGGSAAVVAAGLVPASTGTDTGGSIRQPAAFCGLVGMKPTYGRISRWGMIAFASSLDQAGPLTHTAEDAALLLEVMSGFDNKDSTSINQPVPKYSQQLTTSLQGLKIGLPKEYFNNQLDPQMSVLLEEALTVFKKLGAQTKEISLPNTGLAAPAYYVIAPAECSSNLARFDGVRFGHRCGNPTSLDDLYKRSRSEGFGEEVKRRIMVGTYALSSGYYDAYYLKAQKIRQLIRQDFLAAFNEVDIIFAPTAPTPAFRFGEKSQDPIAMYLSDVFTIPVNLAGLPALSMPVGFINHPSPLRGEVGRGVQLPIGGQLIGRDFSEAQLLNAAHQYQLQTDWHLKTPEARTA